MTIWNLGSVNADLVYAVPHLPEPGETLSATGFTRGLGGKGANMSVACARAGSRVEHLGAVGPDGLWMKERLGEYGVGTAQLAELSGPSGHAVIYVDEAGENEIVILPGTNRQISPDHFHTVLNGAKAGDIAVTQNETNAQAAFTSAAREKGLRVAYAAAPFEAAAVAAVLEDLDYLVMNEVEAQQLEAALGLEPAALPVAHVVITLGARGCRWIDTEAGTTRDFAAPKVTPVDTTGAGDTFTGYLLAGLDQGMGMEAAILRAQKAASIMVTRVGTADAIPAVDEL